MKKIYSIFFILNILATLAIFTNVLFLASYNTLSIPTMIGIILFYITMIILYFKHKHDNNIFLLSVYIIFFVIYILFVLKYQEANIRTYNMLYFSKIMLLPSIIYTLYCVFDRK